MLKKWTFTHTYIWASLMAQIVKNLPEVQETWVWSLGQEGLPTPIFVPGEFHRQRNLVAHSPWGHKESDTTATTPSLSLITTSADMVTVDGPALTPSVTQNPQPTLGFLPGAVCSLGLDQCVMTCIHHYSIRVFPPHEKSSVLFSFSSFSSSNCWHPLIF